MGGIHLQKKVLVWFGCFYIFLQPQTMLPSNDQIANQSCSFGLQKMATLLGVVEKYTRNRFQLSESVPFGPQPIYGGKFKFFFQSGEPSEVTSEEVELLLSDPQEDWDVVKDDPDFLLVGEKKVRWTKVARTSFGITQPLTMFICVTQYRLS